MLTGGKRIRKKKGDCHTQKSLEKGGRKAGFLACFPILRKKGKGREIIFLFGGEREREVLWRFSLV